MTGGSSTSTRTLRSGAVTRVSSAACADQLAQVHGHPGPLRGLVQGGQRQQVLHQDSHPRRFGLDPCHRSLQRRRVVDGAQPEQLRVAANRRQRRAQLMGRVGQEPPELILALPAGGEGSLDLPEHLVQRPAQTPHLGALVRRRHPPGEVARRDLRRDAADALQRPQPDADDHPAEQNERQDDAAADQPLHHHEPVQGVVGLLQRYRRHHVVAAGDRERGRPVARIGTAARVHREQLQRAAGAADREARGEIGRGGRRPAVAERAPAHDAPTRSDQLAEGARGQTGGADAGRAAPQQPGEREPPAARGARRTEPGGPQLEGDGAQARLHLLIHAIEQERPLLLVGGHGGHQEPGGDEDHHPQQQARPQRHQSLGSLSA